MSKKILILNGPGLGGIEQINPQDWPGITLQTIKETCTQECTRLGLEMSFRQSEQDDEIFRIISTDATEYDLLILNPIGHNISDAAKRLKRYHIATKALADQGVRVVEIHMNNIFHKPGNTVTPLQEPGTRIGFICGLGIQSYSLALQSATPAPPRPKEKLAQPKIRILNGPNLNLLGIREPEIYGTDTLENIKKKCKVIGVKYGCEVEFLQSNHEGDLVGWIQDSINTVDSLVINSAAYTHTSVAIHDALKMYTGFALELHISNPHTREKFRHFSYVSSTVNGVIAGLGVSGYELAIRTIIERLGSQS